MYQFHTQEPESQQPKFIQKENLLDLGQNNQSAYLQASPKQRERLDEYIGFLLERDFIPRSKTHTELHYAYKALYPSPPPDLIAELWVKVASMVQLKAETPPGWSWAGIEKNNEPAELAQDHRYARHPILWRDRLLKGVNQPLPLDNSAGFRDPCLQYGIQINPISDDMYYACCGLPLNHPGCWRGPKKNEIVPYLAFDLTDWDKKMPSGTRYIVYESDNAFYDQIETQVEELKQNIDLTSKTLTTQLKLNQILKLEAKYNRCAKERQIIFLEYESEEEEEDLESEVSEEEVSKEKDLESEDEIELPKGKDKEAPKLSMEQLERLFNLLENIKNDPLITDYLSSDFMKAKKQALKALVTSYLNSKDNLGLSGYDRVIYELFKIDDTNGKFTSDPPELELAKRSELLSDIMFTLNYRKIYEDNLRATTDVLKDKLRRNKDAIDLYLTVFNNPSQLLKIYMDENVIAIASLRSVLERFITDYNSGDIKAAERSALKVEEFEDLIDTIGELQNFKLPKEANLSFYDSKLDDELYRGVGIFEQLKKEYQLVQMIEKLNLAAPNLFTQDYPDKVKADLDALLMKMDETLVQFLIDNAKYKVEPADSDKVKDAKERIQAEAVKQLINQEPLKVDPQLDQLVLQAEKKLTVEPVTWEQLLDEAKALKDVDNNSKTYYLRALLASNVMKKANTILDKTDIAVLEKYLSKKEMPELLGMITNALDISNLKPTDFGADYRKGLISGTDIDISLFNTFNSRFTAYNYIIDGINKIEKNTYNYDWPNGVDRNENLNRRYDFQEKLKEARKKFGTDKFNELDDKLDNDIQAYIRDQVEEGIFQGLFDKYLEPEYNVVDDRLNPFKAAYIRAKFGLDKTKTVVQAAKELKDEIERLRNLLTVNEIVLTNDEIPYVDLSDEAKTIVDSLSPIKLERVPEWFRYLNQSEQLRDAAEFYLDSLGKN